MLKSDREGLEWQADSAISVGSRKPLKDFEPVMRAGTSKINTMTMH